MNIKSMMKVTMPMEELLEKAERAGRSSMVYAEILLLTNGEIDFMTYWPLRNRSIKDLQPDKLYAMMAHTRFAITYLTNIFACKGQYTALKSRQEFMSYLEALTERMLHEHGGNQEISKRSI